MWRKKEEFHQLPLWFSSWTMKPLPQSLLTLLYLGPPWNICWWGMVGRGWEWLGMRREGHTCSSFCPAPSSVGIFLQTCSVACHHKNLLSSVEIVCISSSLSVIGNVLPTIWQHDSHPNLFGRPQPTSTWGLYRGQTLSKFQMRSTIRSVKGDHYQ